MNTRILVARLDSDGDVLLSGPAIRAAARQADVTLLCGPAGKQAAALLPGVDRVLSWYCPWIAADAEPVNPSDVDSLIARLRDERFALALILTSAHQSSLPLALVLRLAQIPVIVGISEDYPGSLLDIRLRQGIDFPDDAPEPERALAVAAAAGLALPAGDDGALEVLPSPDVRGLVGDEPYVVMHPGATAPARTWPAAHCRDTVEALRDNGFRVLVTGSPAERELTALVAGRAGIDLGGRTTYAELAGVLAAASTVIVGNTGPAHLAAAVGTPVVSLFAPVVPAARWAPYRVPHRLLGDQHAPCRDSRARTCPIPGHPCLASVSVADVINAVHELMGVMV
jgi:ADP-heptose:LPS heptosyltransferase